MSELQFTIDVDDDVDEPEADRVPITINIYKQLKCCEYEHPLNIYRSWSNHSRCDVWNQNPAVYSLETIYLINIDKINYRSFAVKSTHKVTVIIATVVWNYKSSNEWHVGGKWTVKKVKMIYVEPDEMESNVGIIACLLVLDFCHFHDLLSSPMYFP